MMERQHFKNNRALKISEQITQKLINITFN